MSGATAGRRALPGAGLSGRRSAGWIAAAGLLLAAGWIAAESHAGHVLQALPYALRAGAATVVLFAVAGYGPALLLAPERMRAHLPLLVLPLGAVCSSLALTVLGFVHVPFAVSLSLVLAVGVVTGVLAHRRRGPSAGGGRGLRLAWPAYIALFLVGLTLLPAFQAGFTSTLGTNPDAHLVTGAAEVVRKGPPTAIHPELPVDRVSPFWKSKYPIYYSLAAVSSLSGLDPVNALPVLAGALLALFGAGVFLFAFYALGAGPVVSLLAMALVPLDGAVLYLVVHPYYNQLWGMFAFPFMLLFGFRYLHEPSRASAVLFVLFLALGLFAYPLMLPFPALALGVAMVVGRRDRPGWLSALRLPRPRAGRWLWLPLALVGLWVVALLGYAGASKGVDAVKVIAPGGNLSAWQGDQPDFPFARFFGIPAAPLLAVVGLAIVLVAGLLGLRRLPRAERAGLGAMVAGAFAMGLYFAERTSGSYFRFKVFAFLGPLVLLLAVVAVGAALARRRGAGRAPAAIALAFLVVVGIANARDELDHVPQQASKPTFELRRWAGGLPKDASVRLDVPPSGVQLWAAYMMHERPLSARAPLFGTTYPIVVPGIKADYVLVERRQRRPRDAVGVPLRRNSAFMLYRLDPKLPGPDRSSRVRLQPEGAAGQ